jgi:hypothetical protein
MLMFRVHEYPFKKLSYAYLNFGVEARKRMEMWLVAATRHERLAKVM